MSLQFVEEFWLKRNGGSHGNKFQFVNYNPDFDVYFSKKNSTQMKNFNVFVIDFHSVNL